MRIAKVDGTLGRIIHDDELYTDIRETVRNVNAASQRIRPILDNVRILTDKLAVDPGGELIKRGLDRRPVGTGRKWGEQGMPLRTEGQHDAAADTWRW